MAGDYEGPEAMTWNDRAIEAHGRMTLEDWDAELENPLPVDRKNVYEGDLGMRDDLAERMVIALEQIALELGSGMSRPAPLPVARAFPGLPDGNYVAQQAPHQPVQVGNPNTGAPTYQPATCPVHGQPWRQGRDGGAYCPRKNVDQTWCRMKPQVIAAFTTTAGVLP